MKKRIEAAYLKMLSAGENISIASISKRMGISRTTFYLAFSSVDEIEAEIESELVNCICSTLDENAFSDDYFTFCLKIARMVNGKEIFFSDRQRLNQIQSKYMARINDSLSHKVKEKWRTKANLDLITETLFVGIQYWNREKAHAVDELFLTAWNAIKRY